MLLARPDTTRCAWHSRCGAHDLMNRANRRRGHAGRVREIALTEGLGQLSDRDLLALALLGSERAAPEAGAILERVGSLPGLMHLTPLQLSQLPRLTERGALRLAASFELARRIERYTRVLSRGEPLTPEGVARWALPRLSRLEHEEVWVLCVDAQLGFRAAWQVARGGAHGCALVPRDLLTPVVRSGAAGFILVHNHPSGDPTPSREDLSLTQSVQIAAQTLGTPLLDHVIVAGCEFRSLREVGHLAA